MSTITVKKDIKCSGGFRDTTRNSSWYYTKIGKAWTNSCRITNYFVLYLGIPSALHFLSNSLDIARQGNQTKTNQTRPYLTKPNQTSRILRILLTSTILCRIERDPDIERLASEARRLSMGVMQDRRGSLATDNQVHNNLQAFWLHRISGLVLWYPVYSRIPDLTAGYPAAAGNRGYQISEKVR